MKVRNVICHAGAGDAAYKIVDDNTKKKLI